MLSITASHLKNKTDKCELDNILREIVFWLIEFFNLLKGYSENPSCCWNILPIH